MAIQETNFIELLLRDKLIGMTIYDDVTNPIVITDLNFDPLTNSVYIADNSSPPQKYKLNINKNFDFDYTQLTKIVPNQHLIIGKRTR